MDKPVFVSARQRAINDTLFRIGQGVSQRRLLERLTQDSLAAKAGISRRTLARIESGDPGTRLESLVAVAGVLGIQGSLAEATDPAFDPATSATALANIPRRGRL